MKLLRNIDFPTALVLTGLQLFVAIETGIEELWYVVILNTILMGYSLYKRYSEVSKQVNQQKENIKNDITTLATLRAIEKYGITRFYNFSEDEQIKIIQTEIINVIDEMQK